MVICLCHYVKFIPVYSVLRCLVFVYFVSLDAVNYDGASVNSKKKKFNFFFSTVFFTKNSRKNKFKFIFSNVFPKTAEKINLNLFFLLFHIVCPSPARCPPSPLPREHSLFEFDGMW